MATEDTTESTNSRDDVAAAFDAVEARESPVETPVSLPAGPEVSRETPAEAALPETRQEGRDALGRFAPKQTPQSPAATPPAAPTQAVDPTATPLAPPPTPTRFGKPPASWAPQEASHWDKTPPEVREAVHRREHEMQRVMQESASARQGLSQLQEVIAPYIPNINAANGGDVVTAIKTFFDYDNRLRHGSQIEKARAVTQLIKGYGVDINALDTELAGAPHSPEQAHQDAIAAALQKELAPYREFMAQQRQQQVASQEALAQEVGDGLEQFASDAAHPYYEHVRSDMADQLEIAVAQGRKLTLQDAYDRACWQNPQIRNILISAQSNAAAGNQHQAAQRAKAAAVGVRNAPRAGAPAAAIPPEQRTRADDIAAAFAQHSGEV